jgi:DNA-directed RNA polymerase subunit RPC12/RpoP
MTAQPDAVALAHARRERPPLVFTTRPRCPSCGSVRLHADRTLDNGDGTLLRYSRCRECGQKIHLVVE